MSTGMLEAWTAAPYTPICALLEPTCNFANNTGVCRLHGKLDQKCHHLLGIRTGWDVGEVCSPALQKHDQRQKGQQALTKYIRHDSSSSRAGKRQQHRPSVSTVHLEVPDEDSLLKVKPVKAAQSISAALSRQTHKKAAAKAAPAFTAEEAADVLAVSLVHACHTGTDLHQCLQFQSA